MLNPSVLACPDTLQVRSVQGSAGQLWEWTDAVEFWAETSPRCVLYQHYYAVSLYNRIMQFIYPGQQGKSHNIFPSISVNTASELIHLNPCAKIQSRSGFSISFLFPITVEFKMFYSEKVGTFSKIRSQNNGLTFLQITELECSLKKTDIGSNQRVQHVFKH